MLKNQFFAVPVVLLLSLFELCAEALDLPLGLDAKKNFFWTSLLYSLFFPLPVTSCEGRSGEQETRKLQRGAGIIPFKEQQIFILCFF